MKGRIRASRTVDYSSPKSAALERQRQAGVPASKAPAGVAELLARPIDAQAANVFDLSFRARRADQLCAYWLARCNVEQLLAGRLDE